MCMVTDNLQLVHFVLKKYFPYTLGTQNYEDLYQVGCIGLVKAAKNFDASKGYTFITYASNLIWGEIKRNLRDDISLLHLNREDTTNLSKLRGILCKKGEDLDSAAEKLGMTYDEAKSLYDNAGLISSIDYSLTKSIRSNAPVNVADLLKSNVNVEEETITKILIEEKLKEFDDVSKQIIVLRYLENKSQNEIADVIGLSQAQVSRILKRVTKDKCLQRVTTSDRSDCKYHEAVKMLDAGMDKTAIIRTLDIKENTFRNYKSKYNRSRGINGRRKAV